MKKGVIFDLDGTLWDVSKITYDSVNQVAKTHKLKEVSMDVVYNVFGLTKRESVEKYFPSVELEKALKLGDELSNILISNLFKFGGVIYDGLKETLKTLKKENYSLFIVSNTGHKKYIEAFFNSSNLGNYFTDYLAASALNMTKAKAIKRIILTYSLENCIYVGDTEADLDASLTAKVPFVYANYGFGHDLNTRYIINDIKELPNIIQNICKNT